jgi:glutaminase
MAGLPVLQALDDWPVPNAAAAVVGPSGVLASHGETDRPFALASVTKLLAARAAQIAIEDLLQLRLRGARRDRAAGDRDRVRPLFD